MKTELTRDEMDLVIRALQELLANIQALAPSTGEKIVELLERFEKEKG